MTKRTSIGALLFLLLFIDKSAFGYTEEQALKIARQTFETATRDIYLFTEACLFFHDECGTTTREHLIGRGIVIEIAEHGWPEVIFASEKASPGSFQIDGEVRLAKTGSEPKDPIYINTDLIVQELPGLGFQPLKFPRAIGILAHEFGHHFLRLQDIDYGSRVVEGPITHEELDVLGSKVAAFLETRTQKAVVGQEGHTALVPGSELSFEIYLAEAGSGQGDYNYGSQAGIYLTGPFGFVALRSKLADLTRCPRFSVNDVSYSTSPLYMYFERFQKGLVTSTSTHLDLEIRIPEAWVICELSGDSPLGSHHAFGKYKDGSLHLPFDINGQDLSFDDSSLHLSITVPPDENWHGG